MKGGGRRLRIWDVGWGGLIWYDIRSVMKVN